MPAPGTAWRRQTAVLWAKTGTDAYGEATVNLATPVEITVRWNQQRRQARDPQGNTVMLDATAVVESLPPIGSLLWLGTHEDYLGVGSAGDDSELHQVVTHGDTPDWRGRFATLTVGLQRWRDALPDGTGG